LGFNVSGQLGDGTNTDKNSPVQIGSDTWSMILGGNDSSIGIKSNGTLWAWGANNVYQLGNGTNTDSNTPVQIGSELWSSIGGRSSTFFGLLPTSTIPTSTPTPTPTTTPSPYVDGQSIHFIP